MTRLLTLGNSRSGFVVASTLMSNVFESSCIPYASIAASGEIDNPASKHVAHGVGIQTQGSPISVARARVCQPLEASHQCPKPKRRF